MSFAFRPGWIDFNPGTDDEWAAPIPVTGDPVSIANAYDWFMVTCPTTKEATAKLAAIRRALRAAPKASGGT